MEREPMISLLKIQIEMGKEKIIANVELYHEIQELRKRLVVMQRFLIQIPDFAVCLRFC